MVSSASSSGSMHPRPVKILIRRLRICSYLMPACSRSESSQSSNASKASCERDQFLFIRWRGSPGILRKDRKDDLLKTCRQLAYSGEYVNNKTRRGSFRLRILREWGALPHYSKNPQITQNLCNLWTASVGDLGRIENAVHRVFVTFKVLALCRKHEVDPLYLAEILAVGQPLQPATAVGVFRIGFTK